MIFEDDSKTIKEFCESYGLSVTVVEKIKSPAYTRYTLKFKQKKHLSHLMSQYISDTLGIIMSSVFLRMVPSTEEDTILFLEVPNKTLETVSFKKMMEQYKKLNLNYKLPVFLGVDGENKEQFADLVELENIIVAGTTGSGKSTFNHTLICSLITKYAPKELKLFLADPKRVELLSYKDLPHLIGVVHIDCEDILCSLESLVLERTKREKLFKEINVKNFNEHNSKSVKDKLPYIVIVIDTFSDLMAYDAPRFENCMQNLLSDSARYGIHAVICDSRPSKDVFSKVLMNLFPTKIAFNTASQIDSRVILGQVGAEKLLGRGDMLFLPKGTLKPIRIQAQYISEDEINKSINKIK